MTYEQIVKTAQDILCNKDVKDMEGHLAVQIDVTGEGEGAFYVELKEGKINVEPYEYYDRDCKLIASADTLTKLIEGKLDPVFAFTTGKLSVEGSIDKALEFQKLVSAKDKKKAPAKAKAEKPAAKAKEEKPAAKKCSTKSTAKASK